MLHTYNAPHSHVLRYDGCVGDDLTANSLAVGIATEQVERLGLMSEIPSDLKYTKDHEWLREQDDGSWAVGITDHAQMALGDLVFVELPENSTTVVAGDACAVVESVKAASDVYCPVAGEISSTNGNLDDSPELVNSDPYGQGWLFTVMPDSPAELDELLSSDDYERLLTELEDEPD